MNEISEKTEKRERESSPLSWIEEFKDSIELYYQGHPDPFIQWFRSRQSEKRFKDDCHLLLTILAHARFDQMNRCYGMPMERFTENGWGWFVKSCQIEFKRPLSMGENVIVRTWLDSVEKSDALVRFQIFRKRTMKIAAEGSIVNTMISTASGRAIPIPAWVITQYTQFRKQESP